LNESHQSKKKYGGIESCIIAVFAGGNHSWAIRDVDEFERRAIKYRADWAHKQQLSIIKAEKELNNYSI